jgi:ribosomal protein L37E
MTREKNQISENPPAFTCPKCGLKSWHPRDAEERFCSRCKFVETPTP